MPLRPISDTASPTMRALSVGVIRTVPAASPPRASSPLSAPALVPTRRSFLARHLLIPAVLVAVGSLLLMAGSGDQWLADHLYRWEGSRWALKDAWLTTHLIHKGGKNLSVLGSLLVLLGLLRSSFDARWKPLRQPLLYLFLAVGLSTGMVALIKAWTQMDCPWDLQRYGGLHPFIGLFQSRPAMLGHNACFPAGHASAGYGWIALYFFALQVRPQWRWAGLALALCTGLVFGFSQQLRGAHFLSHDLWSLAISWTVAVLLYLLMFPPRQTRIRAEDQA